MSVGEVVEFESVGVGAFYFTRKLSPDWVVIAG